jgi:MFS family permease
MGIANRFVVLTKLDRDLKLLIASVATRRVVMASLQVMRNLYLYSIGFDLVGIGLLSTIAMVVGAIRSGVIGVLSDRYGRKPFIIVGGLSLLLEAPYQPFVYLFMLPQWISHYWLSLKVLEHLVKELARGNLQCRESLRIRVLNRIGQRFSVFLHSLTLWLQ